jgi:hypothetical protein
MGFPRPTNPRVPKPHCVLVSVMGEEARIKVTSSRFSIPCHGMMFAG